MKGCGVGGNAASGMSVWTGNLSGRATIGFSTAAKGIKGEAWRPRRTGDGAWPRERFRTHAGRGELVD